jgi:hypothetical protein
MQKDYIHMIFSMATMAFLIRNFDKKKSAIELMKALFFLFIKSFYFLATLNP